MMAETANGRGWPRTAGRSQEILSTFTRYVAERGYDGTNFSDIANELGISKGTIVHHYGTKDRLLAALHESYMRRRLAEARLIVERLDGPVEQLAGLLHAFIRYQVHDRDATVAFQREVIQRRDPFGKLPPGGGPGDKPADLRRLAVGLDLVPPGRARAGRAGRCGLR
jgi:AcrR family transcriptional regulator